MLKYGTVNSLVHKTALFSQVLDIQRAVAARLHRFVFEGTEMQLKWSAWSAITMNPGYAGGVFLSIICVCTPIMNSKTSAIGFNRRLLRVFSRLI